jgi:hypothetical protein
MEWITHEDSRRPQELRLLEGTDPRFSNVVILNCELEIMLELRSRPSTRHYGGAALVGFWKADWTPVFGGLEP